MVKTTEKKSRELLRDAWNQKVTAEVVTMFAQYQAYPEHLRDIAFNTLYTQGKSVNTDVMFNPTLSFSVVVKLRNTSEEAGIRAQRLHRNFQENEVEQLLKEKLTVAEYVALLNCNVLTRSQVETVYPKAVKSREIADVLLAQEHVTEAEREELLKGLSRRNTWRHLALNPHFGSNHALKMVENENARTRPPHWTEVRYIKTCMLKFEEIQNTYFDIWCKEIFKPKQRNMLIKLLSVTPNLTEELSNRLVQAMTPLKGEGYTLLRQAILGNPFLALERKGEKILEAVCLAKGELLSSSSRRGSLNTYQSLWEQSSKFVNYGRGWGVELAFHAQALEGRGQELLDLWNKALQPESKENFDLQRQLLESLYQRSSALQEHTMLLVAYLNGNKELTSQKYKELSSMLREAENYTDQTDLTGQNTVEGILDLIQENIVDPEKQKHTLQTFLVLLHGAGLELRLGQTLQASAKVNGVNIPEPA